jgi:hypothetical protein
MSKTPKPDEISALVDAVRDNMDEICIKVRKIKCDKRRHIVTSAIVEYFCNNTDMTVVDIISITEMVKMITFMGKVQNSGMEELLSSLQGTQGINIPKRDIGVG